MHFDLTDLRLFAIVADTGNLTRAAKRHHLSLAAVSARVKALEAQAGLPLLHREARGVRLTAAGETFLEHALAILRQADRMERDLQGHDDGLEGQLVRVFAITTGVTDFLPQVLPGFLARHPGVGVDVQERPNADIARGVFDNRADIGIAAGQVTRLGLEAIHFSSDRLVLVAPPGHPLAAQGAIRFEDIRGEPLVSLHHGSTLQLLLAQEAEKLNMPLRHRLQVASFDVLCRMVAAGVGVGLVPDSTVLRLAGGLELAQVALAEPWAIRERYILTRGLATLPSAARELVDDLCSLGAAMGTASEPGAALAVQPRPNLAARAASARSRGDS